MDQFIYRLQPESLSPKSNDNDNQTKKSHDESDSESSKATSVDTSSGTTIESAARSASETVTSTDTSTATVVVAQYIKESGTSKNNNAAEAIKTPDVAKNNNTEGKKSSDDAKNKAEAKTTSNKAKKDKELKNGDTKIKGDSKTKKKDNKKKEKDKTPKKSEKDKNKDSTTEKGKPKEGTTELAKGDGAAKKEDAKPGEESKQTSDKEPKSDEKTEQDHQAEAAKLLKALFENEKENEDTEGEGPQELLDRWRPTTEWGVEEPKTMTVKLIPDHQTIMERLVQPPETKDPPLLLFKGIRPPGGFFEEDVEHKKKKNIVTKKKKKSHQSKLSKGPKRTGLDEQTQVSDDEIEAEMNKDEKRDDEDEDDDLSEFMKHAKGDNEDDDEGDGDSAKGHAYTGMFRDGIRRVDYVLVTSDRDDPEEEKFKVNFLTSLVKLGLQLQFERGRQKNHRHLYFIKIHAPDHVLDEFAEPLGVKKFFKEAHLRHYGANRSCDEILFSPSHEKTWIKLVRQNYIRPLQYSNHERSLIVYMLLKHQPFGTRRNHFGLQRLLNHSIIQDAYALHDGPYFIVKDQDYLQLNARQILHYSWIGVENAFRYQPINLIHEYYGPKVVQKNSKHFGDRRL